MNNYEADKRKSCLKILNETINECESIKKNRNEK